MTSLIASRIFGNSNHLKLIFKPSHLRCISTSKKNRDTATVTSEVQSEPICKVESKNWVSYGFSEKDQEEDEHVVHGMTFMSVTVLLICGSFILAYRPDYIGRNWAQREGFLELRRREKLGLPLIDPDYLPLDKIILPTDEELGNTEVVV